MKAEKKCRKLTFLINPSTDMQIVLVYSQVVHFSYVKISNDVTVINFFSNVINLQLGNSATGYPFQSRSLSHIPFEFLFPFRAFDIIWIRVYSSFIMNMSDSLTSIGWLFSCSSWESIMNHFRFGEGYSCNIFPSAGNIERLSHTPSGIC